MNNQKGFGLTAVLLVVLGIIVLGGGGYVAMNPEVLQQRPANETAQEDDGVQTVPGDHEEVDRDAEGNPVASTQTTITWSFTDAGEVNAMPYTNVSVVLNGKTYAMGKFLGSCAEIGANGGIDGKGLLAGELSAAQCWFAGGGNEIGVFAHEDGGYQIMVGELSEGEAGDPLFRGDFSIKNDIRL